MMGAHYIRVKPGVNASPPTTAPRATCIPDAVYRCIWYMYVTQYCPGSGNCYSRLPACFLCIGFGTVSAETLRVGMVCAYAPFN